LQHLLFLYCYTTLFSNNFFHQKYCLQHILDLKKHKTSITKFKNELQKTKNQLVPMYLKENQRKKLSTANMVTTLSSMTKS